MPPTKTSPTSLSPEERRLRSRLHQLLSRADGFLHGSLIEMARRCGNPRCRCASDEDSKHRSLYLGQTRGGKTRMEYVPRDQEQTVRRRVENFQRARDLLEALSQQGWQRLKEAKAAKAKKKSSSKAPRTSKTTTTAKTARKKSTRKPPARPS
jgi:hypothetical protein